ncbi:MAG: alpha/beta hydrolase [Pseudomonadota bacterium]
MIGFAFGSLGVAVIVFAALTWAGSRHLETKAEPTGQLVEVDGTVLHLVEKGHADPSRPSLIFVHGASSNYRDFQFALEAKLAKRFGNELHRIYIDRPGQGASGRSPGDHAPDVQARRILEAASALGVEQALVVGHSWGGSVVAQMALQGEHGVAGAVFVAPATHPWPGDRFEGVDWHYALADTPLIGWLFTRLIVVPIAWFMVPDGVENAFAPEAAVPGYAKSLRARLVLRPRAFQANAEDVHRLRRFVIAEAPRYEQIDRPVHIVTGDADGVVWAHIHSDGLERDIAGAVKTVIEGAGHMPHQTHPDIILDAIDDVMQRAELETSA